jgi:hypothetical protein
MLSGLPADFRTSWTKIGSRILSEHERFTADVYANGADRFAEGLFSADASAGTYLLEHQDAGIRFAIADPEGRTIADTAQDAGPSLQPCTRCHASAPNSVFPVTQ